MEEPQNIVYSSVDQLLLNGEHIQVKEPYKVGEGRDSYIVYVVLIKTISVRRRYSDFDSFHELLRKQNPFCIIPPIPEKHTIKTVENLELLEKRRAKLENFLNRVARHPILSASRLFHQFLEVENWASVIAQEGEVKGFSISFSLLEKKVQKQDGRFLEIINQSQKFSKEIEAVDRNVRKIIRRQTELASDFGELGSIMSTFASNEKELTNALENIGSSLDNNFLSLRILSSQIENQFAEPMQDYVLYAPAIKSVLKERDAKQIALESLIDQVTSKREQLKELQDPNAQTGLFKSFTTSFSKMLDSNPEKTRQDNIVKLQTAIEQGEVEIEKANADLLKCSEAVFIEYQRYHKEKGVDMKKLIVNYIKAQVDYHQKGVQSWRTAISHIDSIPTA